MESPCWKWSPASGGQAEAFVCCDIQGTRPSGRAGVTDPCSDSPDWHDVRCTWLQVPKSQKAQLLTRNWETSPQCVARRDQLLRDGEDCPSCLEDETLCFQHSSCWFSFLNYLAVKRTHSGMQSHAFHPSRWPGTSHSQAQLTLPFSATASHPGPQSLPSTAGMAPGECHVIQPISGCMPVVPASLLLR